jgi:hypothetical protein
VKRGVGNAKEGMFVYCIVDAKANFERATVEFKQGKGRRPLRYPSTDHLELLAPAAAKEFRRQRRLGIEPRFDNEGLVPVVVRKSAKKCAQNPKNTVKFDSV